MAEKINELIEQLKSLTLLEASELVEQIEETFGVDASSGGGMMMVAGGGAEASTESAGEEKTEFNLLLAEVPADKKIAILKIVRTLTGLGLKEAKDLVESAPKVVKEDMPKADAEEAKTQLEAAGAKVELK
jgi:large subunit ribosomal protein L7/L12